MLNNVLPLRDPKRLSRREGRHFDILNPVDTAALLPFHGRIDDAAVLARVAPWLRLEAFEEAKSAVERDVNALPASQSDYQRRFSQLAAMAVGMVEQVAFDSKGGFSLDAESRAIILAKAFDLRQTIQRVTIKFDRAVRSDEIELVVKKHSMSEEPRL
jgi:hypothetical protein